MKRVPELEETFPNITNLKYSPTILICGHGQRDQRCGTMGPILQTEFRQGLINKGFSVDSNAIDGIGHANLALISHISGHKYAGNVIIYLPPSLDSNVNVSGTLAGKGIWYGRVEPRHVQGIVEETILKGRVIADHFRGAVGPDGQVFRL
jgi:prenyl protein peptidase